MKKSQRFLRKAGLCLCFLCGLVTMGCSVLKPNGSLRTYRLTVTVFPGSDPLALPAGCREAIGPSIGTGVSKPRHLTFKIRLATEEQLEELYAKLAASGVIVEEMVRVYN
jgi:hypothetical protein